MHKVNTSFAYLASPYTPQKGQYDQNSIMSYKQMNDIRKNRYEDVCHAAAWLMQMGEVVFCPISHSHNVDSHLLTNTGKRGDGEFWKAQDEPYLELCDKVFVLMIDGWDASPGLKHEVDRAVERGVPVLYIERNEEVSDFLSPNYYKITGQNIHVGEVNYDVAEILADLVEE
jgi:hypothetical protein